MKVPEEHRPTIDVNLFSVSESLGDLASCLTVAVVICTRGRPTLLRKCLEGVARLRPAPDEVLVIDNTATGDRQTEFVARDHAAGYIVEPNLGLSRARNRAIVESSSAIIAYLDDDAVPDERWLEFLLKPYAKPDVAAVTGGVFSSSSDGKGMEQEPLRSLNNLDPKWFETAAFGGLGIGANMSLRRSACTKETVFDERLGRGAPLEGNEENHALLSLVARGYSAVHVPSAIVFHPYKSIDLEQEATRSIAYWLLLLFEFPGHRLDLLRFLLSRLRHKPLSWKRTSPSLGPMITSDWRLRLRAGIGGIVLYLRARNHRSTSKE